MIYLILALIIAVVVIIYSSRELKIRKRKTLDTIASYWGRPKSERFNFDLIDRYFLLNTSDHYHRLTLQTIKDIDLQEIFKYIDRTSSRIGQQYLFNKLMHPVNDLNKLEALSANADFFLSNDSLRTNVQLELFKLSNDDAYFVTSLLREKSLARPKWYNLSFVSVVGLIISLVLAFKYPVLLSVSLILIGINIFIHYWNKSNVLQFMLSFPQLATMINVSTSISSLHIKFASPVVQEAIRSLKQFQMKTWLLGFPKSQGIQDELAQLFGYVLELLKAAFLAEVFATFHLVKKIESSRKQIISLFEYLGEIDCALSIASLRSGSDNTCTPDFINESKTLSAIRVYHPLIENCIKNDITINSKGILITGSNMAGKTSFLRTLIVNSILAQTINTCFAETFTSPVLRQFSSIAIADSMIDGKSYYFEEVESVGTLINQSNSQYQNLFVLDEPFKGTNTAERIASAKAVLSYLNSGTNIVIVSTHDLELCALLDAEYDAYHFSETIEGNKLHFDFQLKRGLSSTRNAISILELSGYPEKIIEEARQLARVIEGQA